MRKEHSFKILIILIFHSSALIGILLPMAEEVTLALPGLTNQAQIGLIASLFLVVGACSSLVWAILATKFSRKKLLVISTFEWSLFTFLTIFAWDFFSLFAMQLLTAIGFGAVIPITFSLIIELKEPGKRGAAFGLKETFYVLGIGYSQILSGFLIDFYPWFVPFLIISFGGFLSMILLVMMKLPEKEDTNNPNEPFEELTVWIRKKDLKEIVEKKSNLLLVFFNFALFIFIGAISQFLITMLKNDTDYNFESSIATIFLVIIFASQIPSGILFGNLGDRIYKKDRNGRVKVALICLTIGSILYIIGYSMAFTSTAPLTIIGVFVVITTTGAFFFGGIDPLIQTTLGEINTPRTRTTIYSINYLTYTFGRSISEIILIGILLSFGYYRIGYVFLSIGALMCTLILIPVFKILPKELNKHEDERGALGAK